MKAKHIYIILCILGRGFAIHTVRPLGSREWPGRRCAGGRTVFHAHRDFFGLDVIVSALALLCFVFVDGRQGGVPRWWLAVLATFSVGVSLGLPLYLLLRKAKTA